MKLFISALLAATTLSVAMLGTANAGMGQPEYDTVCTSTTNSPTPPSGTYVQPDGHKWAGFKADGMPPDSLVSGGGTSTSCTQVERNT